VPGYDRGRRLRGGGLARDQGDRGGRHGRLRVEAGDQHRREGYDPARSPRRGAKVALGIAGSQINVKNGDIDGQSTYCEQAETDAAGRFRFAGQGGDFQLVITHPSGFAYLHGSTAWDAARVITLDPWARVEGTFRVGLEPAPDVRLRLEVGGVHSYGPRVPSVFTTHEAVTGPGGRFAFERVIPGKGSLGRDILLLADQGAIEVTSSCMVPAEFPAGKTVHIDLGGTGRAVVGRLEPATGFAGKARWNFALVQARPEKEGGPYLTATVDRNGRFRIDDVPAGGYTLQARFDRGGAGSLPGHPFRVPPDGGEPVDLGTLKLEGR
jgi:hypothetical protein